MILTKANQKTLKKTQINTGNINHVFPLLCPVRERDWIDGWDCKMVHSESGLIEKDCVFTTAHHSDLETVWHVTQYDKENYAIEFLRITPNENTVRINIQLEKVDDFKTKAHISYLYTLLNEDESEFKMKQLEQSFSDSMVYWENAINYYLQTSEMLKNRLFQGVELET
jgi:hypothetical protein